MTRKPAIEEVYADRKIIGYIRTDRYTTGKKYAQLVYRAYDQNRSYIGGFSKRWKASRAIAIRWQRKMEGKTNYHSKHLSVPQEMLVAFRLENPTIHKALLAWERKTDDLEKILMDRLENYIN